MSRTGKLCFTVILIIALLIAFLPTILSTTWGNTGLLNLLNKKIPGSFTMGSASFNWLGKQTIEQLHLKSPQSETILAIDKLELDASLLRLLFNHEDFRSLVIQNASLKLQQDEHGITDLQDALGLKKLSPNLMGSAVYVENAQAAISKGNSKELSIKASGKTRQKNINGTFNLDLSLDPKKNQKISLKTDQFPVLVLDQTLAISTPPIAGLLLNAIGESANLSIEQESSGNSNFLTIGIESPNVHANLQGEINGEFIQLQPGGVLKFTLPPKNAEEIAKIAELDSLNFDHPVEGSLLIDTFKAPLNLDYIEDLESKIRCTLSPVRMHLGKDEVYLESFNASSSTQAKEPKMSLAASLKGTVQENPLQMDVQIQLPKHPFFNSHLDQLFEEGFNTKGQFKSSRPMIQASWDGILKETNSILSASFKSDAVEIPKLELSIPYIPFETILEDGEISSVLHGTATAFNPVFQFPFPQVEEWVLPWTLDLPGNALKVNLIAKKNKTEDHQIIQGSLRVDQFMREQELHLKEAHVQLNLKLDKFDTATLEPLAESYPMKRLLGSAFDADITLKRVDSGNIHGELIATTQKGSEAFVKKISSKFSLQNDNRDVTFEAESQQAIGATHFSGTLHHLFNADDKIALDQASISIQGTLKHFPVGIITKVITGDPKLADTMEAVLGSQVDGELYAAINDREGPFRIQLKGINGQCSLDSMIQNNILYLNAPLTATLKVTPQLEHAVLREYLPILGSALSAETPIALTVPVEGFQLPISDLWLQGLRFQNARLQLEKIQFLKESPLGKIVGILGIQSPKFEVWFTPIYFSFQEGNLQMYRTDMLIANQYPVASWGNINLNAQDLDMVVALSGYTIRKAFHITGIGNDGWIQIPIRGAIHHPKIDIAAITARISALAAVNKAGPPGKIIGTVIEKASDLIGLDQAPPPTTNPLPWADSLPTEEENDNSAQSIEKALEQPIHELKKGAKKLLKGLFD